jgi:hypothetical protein
MRLAGSSVSSVPAKRPITWPGETWAVPSIREMAATRKSTRHIIRERNITLPGVRGLLIVVSMI